MELVGQNVKHVSYGPGVIVQQKDRFVYVDFDKAGQKRFAYPDAFSRFLTFEDASHQDQANVQFEKHEAVQQEKRHQQWAKYERLEQLRNIRLSPQSQAVFDVDPADMEQLMEEGAVPTGTYLSGYSKGEAKVPNRMKPNTACLLTAVPAGGREKDRRILGLFMVSEDFYGSDCKNGLVEMHDIHRIQLPKESQPLYWSCFKHSDTVPRWGRAAFKYFSNMEMQKILQAICRKTEETPLASRTDALYHYYCYVNRLTDDHKH